MKQIKDLTVEEVETELRKLAKASPDFVYNPTGLGNCHYTSGHLNGPVCDGCIFGQALQNLGVPKADLPKNQTTISDLWRDQTNEEPPPYWGDIQSDQDWGASWGEAIKSLELK